MENPFYDTQYPELGERARNGANDQREADRQLLARLASHDSGRVAVGGVTAEFEAAGLITGCGD